MYSLFDVEDYEKLEPLAGKNFDLAGSVLNYTNSTVLHPSDLTRIPNT